VTGLFSAPSLLYGQEKVNYFDLGKHAYLDGNYDLAITNLNESIRLNPNWTHSYYYRGKAYLGKSEYSNAIADLRFVIQLGYNDDETFIDVEFAYNSLAWVLATCPQAGFRDGKKAVEAALKANELNQSELVPTSSFWDTLAAAYAEDGDFVNAIKWENKYLEDQHLSEQKKINGKNRLTLYIAHMPYHDK
jgi:tetratricopeptide (TPR) repeat protein